jgi:flagellar basal body-associated protein FliL
MRREVPVWLAVVIIVVVLVVIAGIYAWLGSPRRQEGGTVAKPPATVIPGQGAQQQPP